MIMGDYTLVYYKLQRIACSRTWTLPPILQEGPRLVQHQPGQRWWMEERGDHPRHTGACAGDDVVVSVVLMLLTILLLD